MPKNIREKECHARVGSAALRVCLGTWMSYAVVRCCPVSGGTMVATGRGLQLPGLRNGPGFNYPSVCVGQQEAGAPRSLSWQLLPVSE